jgi:hypothetical protein
MVVKNEALWIAWLLMGVLFQLFPSVLWLTRPLTRHHAWMYWRVVCYRREKWDYLENYCLVHSARLSEWGTGLTCVVALVICLKLVEMTLSMQLTVIIDCPL